MRKIITISELDEHISCSIDCIDMRTSQMFNILQEVYINKSFTLKQLIISDFKYKQLMINQNKNISPKVFNQFKKECDDYIPYYKSLLNITD